MRARFYQTISKVALSNKYFIEQLTSDGWDIRWVRGVLEVDMPHVLKEGDCISFTSYWGDIETRCYNVRLGMWQYEVCIDYKSFIEE